MSQLEKTPRKSRRRWWIVALILLAIPTILLGRWLLPPPKLKISKETTFITQPLLPNGNPDYVTALNQEWSRGVTPENNAQIPLLEAIGPATLVAETRDQYYQWLGVPVPPLEGDYLVEFQDFVKKRPNAPDPGAEPESDAIIPFTAEERPLTAAWIAASSRPAVKLHEAVTRNRFFAPMLIPSDHTSLFWVMLPELQINRVAAKLLGQRSMLRLGEGDINGAMEDAIACMRLGRLVGHHATIVGNLIGIAIYGVGCKASEQVLLSHKLSAVQVQRFRAELTMLPPLAEMKRSINLGERSGVLQTLVERVDCQEIDPEGNYFPNSLIGAIDLNHALPVINTFFDQAGVALSEPDFLKRIQKLKTFEAAVDAGTDEKSVFRTLAFRFLFSSRAAASAEFGKFWMRQISPSVAGAQTSEDRAMIRQILLETAAAVAEFRTRTGDYPESLQQLVPDDLAAVPLDPYSGKPLNYQRHANGMLLYSIGRNFVEEGGREPEDKKPHQPRPDDIRFGRLPPNADAPEPM